MLLRKFAPFAGLLLLIAVGWLAWLSQPERQTRQHSNEFLKKFATRDWTALGQLMAADFHDRWNHDKRATLSDLKQVVRSTLFLTLDGKIQDCQARDGVGVAHVTVRIDARGGPYADALTRAVNSLHEPLTLTWRKTGWLPWSWQLISWDQPELEIDGDPPL